MRRSIVRVLTLTLVMLAVLPFNVFGADDLVSERIGNNVFSAGNSASVRAQSARDVMSAGNTVDISSVEAKGNIFAAGNFVSIASSEAGADIFAAGQNLTITGTTVEGNLFVAGNNITLENVNAESVIAAGENISFGGSAQDLILSGNSVSLSGDVSGNVQIEAENVYIADSANVTGTLSVKSSREPEISSGAKYGQFEYEEAKEDVNTTVKEVGVIAKAIKKMASLLFWVPAMVVLALLMILLFGRNLDEAKDLILSSPTGVILCGAIGWIAIPAAAVVLAITVIGIPIAGITMMVYITLIWAGLTFTGASMGRMVFPKLHPILASVCGVVILQIVRIIPVVGPVIGIAADMYLLGYVIYVFYLNKVAEKSAKSNVAEIIEQ